jgi:hypothetical protein
MGWRRRDGRPTLGEESTQILERLVAARDRSFPLKLSESPSPLSLITSRHGIPGPQYLLSVTPFHRVIPQSRPRHFHFHHVIGHFGSGSIATHKYDLEVGMLWPHFVVKSDQIRSKLVTWSAPTRPVVQSDVFWHRHGRSTQRLSELPIYLHQLSGQHLLRDLCLSRARNQQNESRAKQTSG